MIVRFKPRNSLFKLKSFCFRTLISLMWNEEKWISCLWEGSREKVKHSKCGKIQTRIKSIIRNTFCQNHLFERSYPEDSRKSNSYFIYLFLHEKLLTSAERILTTFYFLIHPYRLFHGFLEGEESGLTSS